MFKKIKKRLKVIFLIFSIIFALLIIRLSYLQIYKNAILTQQAQESRNYYIPSQMYFRGDIVDCNGKSLLDSTKEQALIVIPLMIKSSENITKLAKILDIEDSELEKKIFNKSFAPKIIKNNLTLKEKVEIEKVNIEGVFTVPFEMRYGSNSLAKHLIGHLTNGEGSKGIELIYNNFLSLNSPEYFWEVILDAKGNIIPGVSFEKVFSKERKTKNVVLTIDKNIQKLVEDVMDNNIKNGAVVVMNPHNGDILAAASRPDFNQNFLCFKGNNDNISYINKAFQYYYPGSIFKILLASAALEESIVKPKDYFFCDGSYELPGGLVIHCWNKSGHGRLNFIEAMAYSCNPVFIEIGLKLGRKNIINYCEKFGLTDNMLIGYNLKDFKSINIEYGLGKIANASMGQEGIRISPVQAAVLISSIANGGKGVTPRIVEGIIDENNYFVLQYDSIPPVRILKKDTVEVLDKMLVASTMWGTSQNAWVENVGTAGKTGTAQTGAKNKLNESILNAWFAGYFPVDNPEYAVIILNENAKSGGKDAAPVFKKIVKKIMELEKDSSVSIY